MPIRSFCTLWAFSTSTMLSTIRPAMYGTAPSAHCQVIAGRMFSCIQGRSISAQCKSDAGGFKQHRLAALGQHAVTDVDVVFPVALIGAGGVADVGSSEQNQRAQVELVHLLAQARQALLAHPVEVDALLPVARRLAVEPARIPCGAACQ